MSAGSIIGIILGSILGVGSISNFYPFSFGFIVGILVTISAEIIFAFAGMEIQKNIKKWNGNGTHKQPLQPS